MLDREPSIERVRVMAEAIRELTSLYEKSWGYKARPLWFGDAARCAFQIENALNASWFRVPTGTESDLRWPREPRGWPLSMRDRLRTLRETMDVLLGLLGLYGLRHDEFRETFDPLFQTQPGNPRVIPPRPSPPIPSGCLPTLQQTANFLSQALNSPPPTVRPAVMRAWEAYRLACRELGSSWERNLAPKIPVIHKHILEQLRESGAFGPYHDAGQLSKKSDDFGKLIREFWDVQDGRKEPSKGAKQRISGRFGQTAIY